MEKRVEKSVIKLMCVATLLVLFIKYFEPVGNGALVLIHVLQPFIIGGAIAFVFSIPMDLFEKIKIGRFRVKRGLSILLTLVCLVGLFSMICLIVVPELGNTIKELGIKIPKFAQKLSDWALEIGAYNPQIIEWAMQLQHIEIDWQNILDKALQFVKSGFGNVVMSTVLVAGNIIGGVVNTFIALIFAIYVLLSKEKLLNQCQRIMTAYMPEKPRKFAFRVLDLLNRNFRSFISGQCMEAVILGFMFFIVLSIFRFPFALLIGVLIGFTALIPVVGAFVGCGVSAFLILVDSPSKVIWFIVIFLILQQIEGNLIYPYVVGNSVGLPSIWVLVAVTVGGSLMGVLGMLLFIPIVSTVYALVRESVNRINQVKMTEQIVIEPVPTSIEEKQIEKVQEHKAVSRENDAAKNTTQSGDKKGSKKRK